MGTNLNLNISEESRGLQLGKQGTGFIGTDLGQSVPETEQENKSGIQES